MRWQGRRQSSNVEDRRGMSPKKAVLGGGFVTIIVIVIALISGRNPLEMLNLVQQQGTGTQQTEVQAIPADDTLAQFVAVVLAETEDVWNRIFSESGEQYKEPKLVLYRGEVQSACGFATSATGPFYCGGDQTVYIDLSFYDDLKSRFGAAGDFAFAYVIAHEVGHHVQNLLGTLDKVHSLRRQLDEKEFNKMSVKLELQADFYAGLWAHYAEKYKGILESGDIQEALNAASAVGDDRLQKKGQGYVVPDAFTHGTSAQRMKWFTKGYESGDPRQGDTFGGSL